MRRASPHRPPRTRHRPRPQAAARAACGRRRFSAGRATPPRARPASTASREAARQKAGRTARAGSPPVRPRGRRGIRAWSRSSSRGTWRHAVLVDDDDLSGHVLVAVATEHVAPEPEGADAVRDDADARHLAGLEVGADTELGDLEAV